MTKTELFTLFLVSTLLAISFPPFPLGFLVPPALVIFLKFLEDKSVKNCFRLGYWFGLFFGTLTLFWISNSTLIGAILAILINSLHYSLVWGIYGWIRDKSKNQAQILFPILWVGMEYLRNLSEVRFNWMTLAHSQTYFLDFIQFIEFSGMHGISLLLCVITICLYRLLDQQVKQKWIYAVSIIIIMIASLTYGNLRIKNLDNQSFPLLKASVVQPNVDAFKKWEPEFQKKAFSMLMDASHTLLAEKPQIIVWPETATPFYLRARFSAIMAIRNFVDSTNTYLLTGTPDYEYLPEKKDYRTFNAAFFFKPNNIKHDYHYKITLVPGSESTPFKKWLPFLEIINFGGGGFTAGDSFTVFQMKSSLPAGKFNGTKFLVESSLGEKDVNIGISPIICYESVFPNFVTRFVKNGANILSIITNDGWFGTSSGPYQHARYAVLRAIENRISILRSANTGISGFIDPAGRYLETAALNTRQNLTQFVPVKPAELTFYTKNGEWLGKLTVLVTLIIIFIKLVSSALAKKSEDVQFDQ